jgi:hypothetical protein
MPTQEVKSNENLTALRAEVFASTHFTLEALRRVCTLDPLEALIRLKFTEVGRDPLSERPLNLIEQVNQTFTYLTSFAAVEAIAGIHPNAWPIILNLGTTSGSDVESQGASVAAEVFAAVRASNNRKLAKDIAKVARTPFNHKYVFYYCPGEACTPDLSLSPSVHVVPLTEEQLFGSLRRGA